jgi:hypothetical protein
MFKLRWEYTDKPVELEDLKKMVGPGWGKIIEEMVEDLKAIGWDGAVLQVKEKFGALRFYYGVSGIPENLQRVAMAIDTWHEGQSRMTCEECGKPGKTRGPGWILTLCAKHALERNKNIEDWEKQMLEETKA